MLNFKLSGILFTVLFSISLALIIYPFNNKLQTKVSTQKLATATGGSNNSNFKFKLSFAPTHENTISNVLSVDKISYVSNTYVSNNRVEGISDPNFGRKVVTNQPLCDFDKFNCDSSDVELYKLISKIESSNDDKLLLSLVQKLWYMAADLGAPESSISTLRRLTQHTNENIADLATRAIKDLIRLNEKINKQQIAGGFNNNAFIVSHEESTNIPGIGLVTDVVKMKNFEAQKIAEIQEIRMTGLNEKQAEKRLLAVKNLLRYRQVEVIDALIEATYDADNRVRHDAINALWIVGQDIKNNPKFQQVLSIIDRATMDTDPKVANHAIKALEDFQRNEKINRPDTDLFTNNSKQDSLNVNGTPRFQ